MTKTDPYRDAAQWAEHEMNLPSHSVSARRGEAAAAFGRNVIEHSIEDSVDGSAEARNEPSHPAALGEEPGHAGGYAAAPTINLDPRAVRRHNS